MIVRTGTSGFSYAEWKGSFYPEKISPSHMLAYYAEHLDAVEINSSFYRMPRRSVLESWGEQVPTAFRFCFKAHRRITHSSRLAPPWDAVDYLLDTLSVLGDRLGMILFQLPPNMRKDGERLTAFLNHLPDSSPVAFEFRHPEWHDEEVCALLRNHGAALALSDKDGAAFAEIPDTSTAAYVRLRRTDYSEPDLELWARRLASLDRREAFVFFKHEEAGAAPQRAQTLARMYQEVSHDDC